MPDKPKRRKNKNKRKNKNNKNNGNKSNVDVDTLSVNSSDCHDDAPGDGCEDNESVLDIEIKSEIAGSTNTNDDFPAISSVLHDIPLIETYSDNESKTDNINNDIKSVNTNIAQIQENFDEHLSYVVEPPDVKKKNTSKLNSGMKSKSVDNDESPSIVEITDDSTIGSENEKKLSIVANTNIIITDAESDIEWEKIHELSYATKSDEPAEAFSVTTIPLEIAQCKQTQCLSSEQENSLRCYLQSLNLPTSSSINSLEIKTEIEQIIDREVKQRLRKKGFTDDIFFQRGNMSRGLDVIDEEGSSESSATSRRHSYLSDKKSDNDDLEDEVFESKPPLAFKKTTFNTNSHKVIPQQCILVDTKLKDLDDEARVNWSLKTVEKITGAEVVYLTDSSSSTSSLYDVGDDNENNEVSDASIRIITPTIEVTDTEKFLTNSFITKTKDRSNEIDTVTKDSKDEIITTSKESTTVDHENKLQDNIDTSSQNPHEIIVLSTEDIKTNLFVKDVHSKELDVKPNFENKNSLTEESTETNAIENITNEASVKEKNLYDLEIKVLKCELNDAINNLIKEVVSDSESISDNPKDTYTRQDSSSSVSSSQCTAKYNPNYSSLNDVSNIMHEDTINIKNNKEILQTTDVPSHVKEVFQYVTGSSTENNNRNNQNTLSLKDLCVRKIASFPFGNKILEELAHVSERLSVLALHSKEASELLKGKLDETSNSVNSESNQAKMPYFPLPDISTIEKVTLSTKIPEQGPPPVQPRNSSLKKTQEEHNWTAVQTTSDPVYVCLSPSQKMLMEKTNTVIRKEDASQLIDTHKKFVDRRGYNENFNKDTDSTPIVPFKSQTGSRLMALIRDPSVTNKISLASNKKDNFKSLDSLPTLNYFENKDHSEARNIVPNSMMYSKSFKPIPPPRPRKFSSSFYESDESSDFTDNSFRSMRSEKKIFHYSTGNLNKEIESDVSSIQNMHRYYSNMRDTYNEKNYPRRPSLPKDLCDQQMEYIRRKEKEVEEEIQRLEQEKIKYPERKGPSAPLLPDKSRIEKDFYDFNKSSNLFSDSKIRKDVKGKLSSAFSKSQEELLREKMYSEYVSQMAEREQRRQQKFIKITCTPATTNIKSISKSMPMLDALDSKVNNRIEKEFICKARERWHKLGFEDPVTEDERDINQDIYREPKVIEHKIKVIQAGEEKDVTKLPSHLQEFVSFTAKNKEQGDSRPGESVPEKEPAHVVFCAVIILVLAVSKLVWRFLQNKR